MEKLANQILQTLLSEPVTVNELSVELKKSPQVIKREFEKVHKKFHKFIEVKKICKAQVAWIDLIDLFEYLDIKFYELPLNLQSFLLRTQYPEISDKVKLLIYLYNNGAFGKNSSIPIENIPKELLKVLDNAIEKMRAKKHKDKLYLTDIGKGIAIGATEIHSKT